MNQRYLKAMETILSAYSDERILHFFNEVKENGFKDQAFARITSNIGILISQGIRRDLLPLFLEMMEFCCKTVPNTFAANNFSVRELVCCIMELEKTDLVAAKDIARWKGYLATIEPEKTYNGFVRTPTDPVRNWALFTAVSEFYRQKLGLCDATELVDLHIAQQLQWIEENGMYMDEKRSDVHQPMVYDLVPRGLFTWLLYAGYRGKYYDIIDGIIKKSALLTLKMQSATGELAFGGRSNQFIHNEAWLSFIFEYEAVRYKNQGDFVLAGKFKAAALQAFSVAEYWLSREPIGHVKNRFPIDSQFGCDGYVYFNKYMITAASFFYPAGLVCDDSIVPAQFDDSAMVWSTSKHFHKTFARAGGYSLEFDVNANPEHDSNGLGRVHKKGAVGTICLSVPFTIAPHYYGGKFVGETEISMIKLGNPVNDMPFSICPAIKDENGEWLVGASADCVWTLTDSEAREGEARVQFTCDFGERGKATFVCSVSKNGVFVQATNKSGEEIGVCLPAFFFDGETYTKITESGDKLCISYGGWTCEYQAEAIENLQTEFANRNGIYKGYISVGKGQASVAIKIV